MSSKVPGKVDEERFRSVQFQPLEPRFGEKSRTHRKFLVNVGKTEAPGMQLEFG